MYERLKDQRTITRYHHRLVLKQQMPVLMLYAMSLRVQS